MAALGSKKRANREFKTPTERANRKRGQRSRGAPLQRCLCDAFFQQLASVNTGVAAALPSSPLINALGGRSDRSAASRSVNLVMAGLTGASEARHPRLDGMRSRRGALKSRVENIQTLWLASSTASAEGRTSSRAFSDDDDDTSLL